MIASAPGQFDAAEARPPEGSVELEEDLLDLAEAQRLDGLHLQRRQRRVEDLVVLALEHAQRQRADDVLRLPAAAARRRHPHPLRPFRRRALRRRRRRRRGRRRRHVVVLPEDRVDLASLDFVWFSHCAANLLSKWVPQAKILHLYREEMVITKNERESSVLVNWPHFEQLDRVKREKVESGGVDGGGGSSNLVVEEDHVLGQAHVEVVDEGAHAVGHLDVAAVDVLESAVQRGRHQRQVVADVRPEVHHHGTEDGVGLFALPVRDVPVSFEKPQHEPQSPSYHCVNVLTRS